MPPVVAKFVDPLRGFANSMMEKHGDKLGGKSLMAIGGLMFIGDIFRIEAIQRYASYLTIFSMGLAMENAERQRLKVKEEVKAKVNEGTRILVASEAEKRILDPNLPAASSVPQVQRQIDTTVRNSRDEGIRLPPKS